MYGGQLALTLSNMITSYSNLRTGVRLSRPTGRGDIYTAERGSHLDQQVGVTYPTLGAGAGRRRCPGLSQRPSPDQAPFLNTTIISLFRHNGEGGQSPTGEGTRSPGPNQSRTIAPHPRTMIEIERSIGNGFCFLDARSPRTICVRVCSCFILSACSFDFIHLLFSCVPLGIRRGAFPHRH